MRKIALHWQILIGLFLGVLWAFASSYLGWSEFTINWINPWGDIFIAALKMIAVPLVMVSIIKGIATLPDAKQLGRMGLMTLGMYLLTTIFAITLGLVLVNVIAPGKLLSKEQRLENRAKYERWVAATDGVETIDGRDLTEINTEAAQEKIDPALSKTIENAQSQEAGGPMQFVVDLVPDNFFGAISDNKRMLQVIVFAIFFAVCLLLIPADKAGPVISFIDGANEIFLKMVDLLMLGAPFFAFALLAGQMSKMAGDDPGRVIEIFQGLGWYALTVVLGLLIMIFIYPLLVWIFTKKIRPSGFFRAMSPAQFLAFSTSSSAATLPVTMDCVHERLGVDETVSSFVLPIGATVNMDGTSLYQAVAVVFLAQFHMVDLSLGQQLTIVLTATLASIGSAAVPSAGLVMLVMVLSSVGLNPGWIAIILPIDRILDMCRTVVNVTGDATVSTIIAKSQGLLNYPPKETSPEV